MADSITTKNWRDLIKPKGLVVDQETLSNTYGKFVAEPLERGFGITLGNSLRRVLLSSLQGAAVTSVKIEGVEHEFMTIPEVAEDVTDIILNLKEVLLQIHTNEVKTIRIEADGPREIKAGDIIADPQVEILNPGHHILTISEGGRVRMEMTARRGRGYVPAEKNKVPGSPIGTIPIEMRDPYTLLPKIQTYARVQTSHALVHPPTALWNRRCRYPALTSTFCKVLVIGQSSYRLETLERQVGRSIQSRFVAQNRFLNPGFSMAEGK
jgi:hypothetical protein